MKKTRNLSKRLSKGTTASDYRGSQELDKFGTSPSYEVLIDEDGTTHKDVLRINSDWGDRMYVDHPLSTPFEDFVKELYEAGYESAIRGGRQELSKALQNSERKKSLKTIRLARGLSQHELAKKAGLQQYQVSRYEAGKEYPSAPTIMKLCKVLNIDQNTFFELLGI